MKKTFWDIQREKKRAITVLFLIFFPFFTLALVGLFHIIKLTSYGLFLRGATSLELLLFSAGISLIIYYLGVLGAKRDRIIRYLEVLRAQKPDPQDLKHKQVQNVVREMAIAATVPVPEVYVIPVLARNAFSAFNIIAVTEGAISSLDRDELQAVVAHEMAHYVRGDSYYKGVLSTFVMAISLFSSVSLLLAGSNDDRKKGAGGAGLIVLLYLMLVELLTKFINSLISRRMEDLADAMAVQFTRNPLALASALWKISRDRTRGISAFSNPAMASLFIVNPAIRAIDESSGLLGDLFSTHPPVNKRINTMLKLAGASRQQLLDRIAKPKQERDWWVEKDGKWLGPFTLEELMEKTWIGEGSKIRGKEGIITFRDILSKFKQAEGECPRCKGPLFHTYYKNVPLLRCGRCGGIIVREDRVLRLIAREQESITEKEMEYTQGAIDEERGKIYRGGVSPGVVDPSMPLVCPRCGKTMQRRFFNFVTYTPVDYCPKCKLFFFDSGEIEMITAGLKRIDSLYTR